MNGGKVGVTTAPGTSGVSFTNAGRAVRSGDAGFEALGGRAQFGQTFDAYGRRFICSNRHPAMHVVLEPSHSAAQPAPGLCRYRAERLKVEAEAAVWLISRASITADFIPALMSQTAHGTFTAASGCWSLAAALGPEQVGNVFVCESAQNLVQRQVVRPEGASFRSEPAQAGREFLSSADVWFRPVFLGEGPDGALYVADMYRREIDHPTYVPEESRGKQDFESGKDRGRIYRIVPDLMAARKTPAGSATADLVRGLESPDPWWRERAQRLLVGRRITMKCRKSGGRGGGAIPSTGPRVDALPD